MTQYLYGVECKDELFQSFFDLIAILAAPGKDKRTYAHITLQGPFRSPKTNLEKLKNRFATLNGLELFETKKGAALVFLIDIKGYREVWDKPHFPEGKPHITIYEGDLEFASKLQRQINEHDFVGYSFEVSQLKQINMKYLPAQQFSNYKTIKRLFETTLRQDWKGIAGLRQTSQDVRINLVIRALKFLKTSRSVVDWKEAHQHSIQYQPKDMNQEKLPLFERSS